MAPVHPLFFQLPGILDTNHHPKSNTLFLILCICHTKPHLNEGLLVTLLAEVEEVLEVGVQNIHVLVGVLVDNQGPEALAVQGYTS